MKLIYIRFITPYHNLRLFMEITEFHVYKRLPDYNYDKVVKLKLNTDNNKPLHGKLYNMLNLKELSLKNITKKSIDRRLLNLLDLTLLSLTDCFVDQIVIDSLGLFQQLKHLTFELKNQHSLPESIYTLSKLETLSVINYYPLEIPLEINYLTELKNLTINTLSCNIGGLFNLDKYSKFKENDTNNDEYHIYGHSLVVFNYIENISIPTNVVYFNILGLTYFINNLPSHIQYLRINNCTYVNNLPFGLKELHIRNKCNNLKNIKIPFGCEVYLEGKLTEI